MSESNVAQITSVSSKDDEVTLIVSGHENLTFLHFWLRDNCRCEECYNSRTFQRTHHLLDIPDVAPATLRHDGSRLYITWVDGHETSYSVDFLLQYTKQNCLKSRRKEKVMWKGKEIELKVARVPRDDFLKSEGGERAIFESLVKYGVAFVTGVNHSIEDTELVCSKLGPIQQTLFGGMWKFTADERRADTAYTSIPLATHTDNTYFTEAAGLQVLHCLEHVEGSGGNTVLVDGFLGAVKLKELHPEDYELLTTCKLEAEYLEEGSHHKYSAPVIRCDKVTGQLEQIRYNVYDRTPFSFEGAQQCREFYSAYRRLAAQYEARDAQWWFKLVPGTVMIFDNFRTLHGRDGFTGLRTMGGCYVARTDWLSRARVLRLIY